MSKALLFAGLAALGNALFVYGQRRSSIANNSFSYFTGALLITAICFGVAAIALRTQQEVNLFSNVLTTIIGGVGVFITFIGFYFLYSNYGAVYYVVYAVLSIVTTTIVVGVLIFRESFNQYQVVALILAILAIVMFSVGQTVGKQLG